MSGNQHYLSIPELIKAIKSKAKLIDSGALDEEEMSILIDSARELYERLVILQYKVFEESVKKDGQKAEKKPVSKAVEDEGLFSGFKLDLGEKNAVKPTKKKEKSKPGKQESIPIPDQPLPFNNPNLPKSVETPIEKVEKEEEVPVEDKNQTNLIDEIADTPQTLNDQMANNEETLSAKLAKAPIQDLKSAIGLNQKFLFMNDLFMGEHDAYHSAIDTLNAFGTKSEATEYINNELASKFEWNMEDNSVAQFLILIDRRFK